MTDLPDRVTGARVPLNSTSEIGSSAVGHQEGESSDVSGSPRRGGPMISGPVSYRALGAGRARPNGLVRSGQTGRKEAYTPGRTALGSLLILSTMMFLVRSSLHGIAELASAVAVLLSILILARHWPPIASRWIAILALGVVSLLWTQNSHLTISALVAYVAVGLPALAAGSILRLSSSAFALALGFFGSAWIISGGVLYNANTWGKLILLGCLALSAFLQESRYRLARMASPLPMACAVPSTIASGSTQVAIGLGIAVLIWIFWRRVKGAWDRWPALVIGAMLATLPALAYLSEYWGVFWGSSATEAVAETGRVDLWNLLWTSCEPHLCGLGSGMGTIKDVTNSLIGVLSIAHNMFLLLLVELGVTGVVLVVVLLVNLLGSVMKLSLPGFPALVFASLAWSMSSDLFNMADFYVVALWLVVGSGIQSSRGKPPRRNSNEP